MSYQALLFCPDQKTARIVTQVLTELEFRVDICSEPFGAVKKLTATQFDAIVVDCDNEQNSALLFKSARNSALNLSSLAVAVVEGQSGVAKAFRIGANLVLTKPINVEQSKGTLRVARGLLKKAEAGKIPAGPQANPKPAEHATRHTPVDVHPETARSPITVGPPPGTFQAKVPNTPAVPAPMASVSSSESPAKADPTVRKPAARPADGKTMENPWKQISSTIVEDKPRHAPEVTGHPASTPSSTAPGTPVRHPFNTGLSAIAGAAVAPAKEVQRPLDKIHPVSDPQSAPRPHSAGPELVTATKTLDSSDVDLDGDSGDETPLFSHAAQESKSRMPVIAALVLFAVGAAGYFGRHEIQAIMGPAIGAGKTTAAQVQPASAVTSAATGPDQTNAGTTATQPQSQEPTGQATTAPSEGQQNSEIDLQLPRASGGEKPSAAKTVAAKNPNSGSDVEVKFIAPEKEVSQTVTVTSSPDAVEQEVLPPSLQVEANTNDQAIAGLVSTTSLPIPKHSTDVLKVSQGITDGMLLKKVAPRYPAQAVQMRKEGTVQLLANIGKNGSITNVKVLKGDALLAQAALIAVQQWKYKPYLLDGQPIAVQTQISVNFTLP